MSIRPCLPKQAKRPQNSLVIYSPDPYSHGRPLNPDFTYMETEAPERDLPEVTQGVMEIALHPKSPTTSLKLEQEASCGPGLTGSKGPRGP